MPGTSATRTASRTRRSSRPASSLPHGTRVPGPSGVDIRRTTSRQATTESSRHDADGVRAAHQRLLPMALPPAPSPRDRPSPLGARRTGCARCPPASRRRRSPPAPAVRRSASSRGRRAVGRRAGSSRRRSRATGTRPRDDPDRDVSRATARRRPGSASRRAAPRPTPLTRVVVRVEHDDPVLGLVATEVREQPTSERRALLRVREVGQVDPHDEPDPAPRCPEADGDGAVARPEPESVRHQCEQLAGFAHPDCGDLHGSSPPAGGRPTTGSGAICGQSRPERGCGRLDPVRRRAGTRAHGRAR